MPSQPYILMIEDDPDDRYLTQSVLEELPVSVPIEFISSTSQLFPRLNERLPILIVMDYNLHQETGIELLQKIKSDKKFSHIPVVILGDTNNPDFTSLCYREGANSYITKPTTIEGTRNKIGLFFRYWLEVAEHNTTQAEQISLR
jgi:CheY-like chemotaxis protein